MDPVTESNENQEDLDNIDPWAAAFASLDQATTQDPEPASDPQGENGNTGSTSSNDEGSNPAAPKSEHSLETQDNAGGPSDLGATDSDQDAGALEDLFRFSEEEISEYKDNLERNVQAQTLADVSAAYIKKGARHTNGKLGASINDADICKRDSDGVPRFYNPETGREFTGDNPRRQAQEWVDDYNKQLADSFNQTCQDYSQRLLKEQGVGLAVIEFAPTYEKLDPVRKAMFEAVIEDYEIRDNDNDIIGYSCDLNKALAAVNRQIKVMQTRFQKSGEQSKPASSGPALDPKTTPSSADEDKTPQFKSLAEAMEYQQNQILKKMKGNN